MHVLVRFLLTQELYYGAAAALLGAIIAIEKGWEIGLRSFFFVFLFLQIVIFILNFKVVKEKLRSQRID